MITREYFDNVIKKYNIPRDLGFTAKIDIHEKFKAMNFYLLATRLKDEEINYYCENYDQLEKLVKEGNLSIHKLAKYIKGFKKIKIDLKKVEFNKKIKLTEEMCKKKIKETLKYDYDAFDIRVGNTRPKCVKECEGIYRIYQYVGKGNKKESKNYEGYQELLLVEVPNLQLIEVSY